MSSSPTIRASSPRQNLLERLSDVRLPSPAIVVGLLLTCVFLLRLPSALVPRELNVDESQMLSNAMQFLVYPRPWKAIDGGGLGPLDSYLLSIPLMMGFKPGFILVHMLASVLVCLQVLMSYLTLRRLGSEKTAAVGAFLMVLWYGLASNSDYLHYSTELLPTLLLMVGFYMFLAWLDQPAGCPGLRRLSLLFLGGLALGAAPWGKLQALPITAALGVLVLVAIFRARTLSLDTSWRVMEALAFACGSVLTSCIMLAIWAEYWSIKDFWYSYILGPLSYAGPQSLTRSIDNFLLLFQRWPTCQPLLVALLSVGLLIYASRSAGVLLLFKKRKWAYGGLLVYAGAALFVVCRVRYSFSHHGIFLVPPMTYLAAVLASPEAVALTKSRRSPHRQIFGLVLVLLFAIDVVQYANLVRVIRKSSHSQPHRNPRIAKVVSDAPEKDSNDTMAKVKLVLTRSMALAWPVKDSSDRIAQVVRDIQRTHPVRSLAIWGWSPGVYVLTGIPPATRDTITFYQIFRGPMQNYFRARFLDDLREKTPDLFIDAVAPDAFMWDTWTENDGYESDSQVRKFVDDNYILVDELMLVKGAKPIRFFARREPASQPRLRPVFGLFRGRKPSHTSKTGSCGAPAPAGDGYLVVAPGFERHWVEAEY